MIKLSAADRALLAEADHTIRKIDSLIAEGRKLFEEMGWEWPSSERRPDEMSEVD